MRTNKCGGNCGQSKEWMEGHFGGMGRKSDWGQFGGELAAPNLVSRECIQCTCIKCTFLGEWEGRRLVGRDEATNRLIGGRLGWMKGVGIWTGNKGEERNRKRKKTDGEDGRGHEEKAIGLGERSGQPVDRLAHSLPQSAVRNGRFATAVLPPMAIYLFFLLFVRFCHFHYSFSREKRVATLFATKFGKFEKKWNSF